MTDTILHGSCLCGAVRYTVTGEPRRFYHCHCRRCRKASGTGHVSNLFVRGELVFDQGEEHIHRYRVPEAERFTNSFCAHCGGRVPRAMPDLGTVHIPAGSLDDEPPIAPQARIFCGSRAAWSCAGDDLPVFDEYPD